jgi:dihydrofolate synthase/folylpolyglutamate synthase
MSRESRYQEALDYLYGLQRLGIKFGLENIARLLQAIGSPQRRLQTIHIAGTNGKGSTAAHLESILIKAGYRVGLYSSPHFVRFTERIRINRQTISEAAVVEWTEKILSADPELRPASNPSPNLPITFFEFTTAMAMAYFVEQQVDLAILEAGLGGRLDATNVCHPFLCIITNISREHEEFLGKKITDIALEKAGIIKDRVPVIIGASQSAVRDVILKIAGDRFAPSFLLGRDFVVRRGNDGFCYKGLNCTLSRLKTGLRGRHQVRNAALALAAVEKLKEQGWQILEEQVYDGLLDVSWRGRQEWYAGPPQVLLDGAHNPEAMRTLCQALRRDYHYSRLLVLMGVMREKDHRRMLRSLTPLCSRLIFCRPRMERAQKLRVLQDAARGLGCRSEMMEDVAQGFATLLSAAGPDDLVLVTGSLFVVGEVLAWLEKNPLQPPGFSH